MAKKIPLRQCTGCREMKPKNDMFRIIKTPEGDICLDKTGRKNGRGAYICANPDCFNKAVKQKGIERTLKTEIPSDIYEMIGRELI